MVEAGSILPPSLVRTQRYRRILVMSEVRRQRLELAI